MHVDERMVVCEPFDVNMWPCGVKIQTTGMNKLPIDTRTTHCLRNRSRRLLEHVNFGRIRIDPRRTTKRPVERICISEHPPHIGNVGYVPPGQIPSEGTRLREHRVHVSDAGHIPLGQILIE